MPDQWPCLTQAKEPILSPAQPSPSIEGTPHTHLPSSGYLHTKLFPFLN